MENLSEPEQDLIETLRAKVKAHDHSTEDLGLVVKSDYEETQNRIDELEDANEQLEDENEDLREEITSVKEDLAEALEPVSLLDAEELVEQFDYETLREKHDEKVEAGEADPLAGEPEPATEDPGDDDEPTQLSDKQEDTLGELGVDDLDDGIELAEMRAEKFSGRGGHWATLAEEAEEQLAILRGED